MEPMEGLGARLHRECGVIRKFYLKGHGTVIIKVTVLTITYNPKYSTYNLTYVVP